MILICSQKTYNLLAVISDLNSLFYQEGHKVNLSASLSEDVVILVRWVDPQQKSVALEMDCHTEWMEEVLAKIALVMSFSGSRYHTAQL